MKPDDKLEAAAREYPVPFGEHFNFLLDEYPKVFKAGAAWNQKEMQQGWIKTSDQHPARQENKRYSQVPCLVVKGRQVMILVFNHEHECWDQEDGDDYDCDIDVVSYWMPLPEPPKFVKEL